MCGFLSANYMPVKKIKLMISSIAVYDQNVFWWEFQSFTMTGILGVHPSPS